MVTLMLGDWYWRTFYSCLYFNLTRPMLIYLLFFMFQTIPLSQKPTINLELDSDCITSMQFLFIANYPIFCLYCRHYLWMGKIFEPWFESKCPFIQNRWRVHSQWRGSPTLLSKRFLSVRHSVDFPYRMRSSSPNWFVAYRVSILQLF